MISSSPLLKQQRSGGWKSPVECRRYDRSGVLTSAEEAALSELVTSRRRWGDGGAEEATRIQATLRRLVIPLRDALKHVEGNEANKDLALAGLLRACGRLRASFWSWDKEVWCRVLGASQALFFHEHGPLVDGAVRQYMIAAAYLLGCFTDVLALGDFKRVALARKIFGDSAVDTAVGTVRDTVAGWGYSESGWTALESAVCEVCLLNHSPYLSDLTAERLEEFRRGRSEARRSHVFQLSKALAALGHLERPLDLANCTGPLTFAEAEVGVNPAWLGWVRRWERTSTLTLTTRRHVRICLLKVGRWLQVHHPEVTSPEHWCRELSTHYIAALDRMKVGDYTSLDIRNRSRVGQPLSARAKDAYLGAVRAFFRDCQEWGWISRRFDPGRVLATPRSVKALIGPAPRTIAADVWAKLLWAGLSLTAEDLPRSGSSIYYPVEFLRALSAVWLFAGLRSDEIVRLRLGCSRWQQQDIAVASTGETLPKGAVCLLDIPVNKTGTAFTKPVDPAVGQAIACWEQVRPQQPVFVDRKTGEMVHFLFCYRARPLTREYFNGSLIPMLCRKANVSLQDVRGRITSHRARATIASQLFNAREPMSLFELQAWLGHSSPKSTQSYVAMEPTKLAKAYADAGYFARNVRAIEVLIDQEAVKTAAAAEGQPWRYYDLGHGLCTYEFFDQCPHRMACARCDFYVPKDSSRGQLLEAKANVLRMLQQVPLTDEERSVADGDLTAVDRLISQLENRPTPSGQTPRELSQRRMQKK